MVLMHRPFKLLPYIYENNGDDTGKLDYEGSFKEAEGITLILSKTYADTIALEYSSLISWITLQVHSSLEAVGLTAAFSKLLAAHNISCNVVAGYHHDHLFVMKEDAKKAMELLSDFKL